jgi:hypothetical protein
VVLHGVLGGVDRGAGRQRRNFYALWRREGVWIEHRRAARAAIDRVEVISGVHAQEFGACRRSRRGRRTTLSRPVRRNRIEDVGPFHALRVTWRRHVLLESW